MFLRIFTFLVGFGLMVIGSVYIIMYLNLLGMGYSLSYYLSFIFERTEVYYLPVGLILITLTMYWKGEKNELHL